ncbi:MAG: hypothetical protein JW969_04010 [Spirochaetales bacterium]|nr:hypothetical protein [Spirochaetales bacterium]
MSIYYSQLTLDPIACHPGSVGFRAGFKFSGDISYLFPYINAVVEKAFYFDSPCFIKFEYEDYRCALYPQKGFLTVIYNEEEARTVIGKLLEFLAGIEARKESIEPDHTVYSRVPALSIYKLLPRNNCKACGFPTCMAYASALGCREANMESCPELSDPKAGNVIALKSLLGEL